MEEFWERGREEEEEEREEKNEKRKKNKKQMSVCPIMSGNYREERENIAFLVLSKIKGT